MINLRNFRPLIFLAVFLFLLFPVKSTAGTCPNGFTWKPSSGIDCIQTNCTTDKIENAHWGSTGHCVCGSAGSIYENPQDPNYDCSYPADYGACPGCVYKCVHKKEECPPPPGYSGQSAAVQPTAITTAIAPTGTCEKECKKLTNKFQNGEVISFNGEYPDCSCHVEDHDKNGRLTTTIKLDGDKKTIYTFNPETGELIKKETFSVSEERQKLREKLGYKYSEEDIDKLLEDQKVVDWFNNQVKDIETTTAAWRLSFWTQHIMAILDHGFSGNSADFVDTYKYGRCGDSMIWLERNLSNELNLEKGDKKEEAMLSITGEKYKNILNHTALIIRPVGISNEDWADMVKELRDLSGPKSGMSKKDIENVNPNLLKARVLDPYFRKITTLEEFIKGWPVLRVS